MAFGHHLGADGRIETEVKRADRYRRLVPFGAMVAVGLAAVLIWCSCSYVCICKP